MGRLLQRALSGGACCGRTKAGGFFFLQEGVRKVFSILQWVLGSCWVIWSLFMVLLILHHSFQSICVPKCCSQKKRNSRAEGVWSDEEGGHGLRATFSCETARKEGRQESGRGRTRSNEGVWGDQLLGQDGGGTTPARVPARSSSQARFREGHVSPFCFFTWLCCPAQSSDCCCFIQLFRHMHLDSAFAVNDLQ